MSKNTTTLEKKEKIRSRSAKRSAIKDISLNESKSYLHLEESILNYCSFANRYISIDQLSL